MHTHQKSSDPVATIGLDIGKNTFHLVGLEKRGALAQGAARALKLASRGALAALAASYQRAR